MITVINNYLLLFFFLLIFSLLIILWYAKRLKSDIYYEKYGIKTYYSKNLNELNTDENPSFFLFNKNQEVKFLTDEGTLIFMAFIIILFSIIYIPILLVPYNTPYVAYFTILILSVYTWIITYYRFKKDLFDKSKEYAGVHSYIFMIFGLSALPVILFGVILYLNTLINKFTIGNIVFYLLLFVVLNCIIFCDIINKHLPFDIREYKFINIFATTQLILPFILAIAWGYSFLL